MAADSPARSVPFFNYQQAFTMHEEEYVRIFRGVMRRGAFIMQQDLQEFEASVAAYLGRDSHGRQGHRPRR